MPESGQQGGAPAAAAAGKKAKGENAPKKDDTETKEAKDLRAQRKAEKAARRANKVAETGKLTAHLAAVAAAEAAPAAPAVPASPSGSAGSAKSPGAGKATKRTAAAAASTATPTTPDAMSAALDKRVGLFRHLEVTAGRSGTSDASKDVHPAILALTLQFASYTVMGSSARCRALLGAFQTVIRDYRTPEGSTLSRNLTLHLSHQIDFLKTARPLSTSIGNAIRWLKQEITAVGIDISDEEARESLISKIDMFIRDRITVAGRVIVQNAATHINDGDVILTFARSVVVEQALLEAWFQKRKFSVVVADSRPFFEGKQLVKTLAEAGIPCEYVLVSALSYVLNDVTTVFLGAHAILSNGRLYSRVGTAMVAMSAKRLNIPVIVCCESIKFTDRVQLDSVTYNELGSPDALVDISIDSTPKLGPLKDWKELPNLKLLNVLYDLTPPDYIKKIVTEMGSLPPSAVPVIIREYKSA
ncbi:initiation factor 2 subunit family-domain-containing protein [Dipodascopsis tothii]|uniref:initiation factor 2 subunit family-domain-containing protein n=1 Tax=Dipodascopsis tothii TaxID=44089 RepID=UPI0034D0028E